MTHLSITLLNLYFFLLHDGKGQSVGHRLEGIAIPHSKHFADATLDERKQIQTWLLLFRLVSASRKHRTVEADRATKLDQMTKDPFLHPTHKVGTFIPRDVEKDVREVSKKLTIPNSDKVERICSLMTAKMAGMNRDESITDLHGRDGNVAKFLNTFQDKFQEFNLRYNDSYGTLLEAVQNKHRMGDDAQASAVKGAEKTAETMVKMTALMRSIHSIHKDVTAIENSMKELGFLKQLVKFRESNMTHFNSPTETLQT